MKPGKYKLVATQKGVVVELDLMNAGGGLAGSIAGYPLVRVSLGAGGSVHFSFEGPLPPAPTTPAWLDRSNWRFDGFFWKGQKSPSVMGGTYSLTEDGRVSTGGWFAIPMK